MTWMIYGASGYTGRLVADLAVDRGERPVLAGRDPAKVAAVAAPRGLPHRTFDLADPDAVDAGLQGVDVVAHCAGPFSATAEAMVDGCLRNGVHYLDITGEIDVFEAVFARHEEARSAGSVLLPGAGFDVVPTDCLAAMVAAELPTATHLDLAFHASGGISGGTLKSALEGAALGGRARVDGEVRVVPMGWRRREVPFPSGPRRVTSLPWGDVSTAYRSTGIGNITTFAHLPGLDLAGARSSRLSQALMRTHVVQRLGKAAIGAVVRGPGHTARSRSWVEVYAEATDDSGRSVCAALLGPDTYDLTADSVLRAVNALQSEPPEPGAHTPSTAFGADFIRRLHGIRIIEPARR
ncbi:saccharopine dehydrogenase (NAD+, L-lysine forming) [Saccharopolyspora kobensis]|uniref:Saccharopine dehydrogenase (NAD+, L-lysine forming) n=1 Tax=Saccharopolyspora kobensis TaxID=146035 RepID=A0A1H6E858_9PSEU|nr:saccharopine dehydrogenase NADP-binding domain-containing protein [Saccharopolyspora kobensis]SEG93451.1 saccharopine dehydrogenase (NAD+, L-lysine forming) [Saccharopolyspora kobensis]SFD45405.1 saccharopine dehydrogenase (NAD+, L-lysine forming) [Saccharopolyspora kobensis]